MKLGVFLVAAASGTPSTSPCPTSVDQCWTYMEATNECLFDDRCVQLTCGPTTMVMQMREGVFGNAEDSEAATGNRADPGGFPYWKILNLADATMTFSADGTKIHFKTRVELPGGSRTRTETADKEIDLGNGLKVITSPHGVGVDFQCDYDTSVEVISSEFTVEDVSISGTHTAAGNLKSGFTMVAGDNSPIVLGNDVTVTTTWALTIAGVTPHYKNCAVTHGAQDVDITKDGCMSGTLGASIVPQTGGLTNAVSMKYKTFTIEGETATSQTVSCDVQLCQGTENCARAADADTTCVVQDDPYGFA